MGGIAMLRVTTSESEVILQTDELTLSWSRRGSEPGWSLEQIRVKQPDGTWSRNMCQRDNNTALVHFNEIQVNPSELKILEDSPERKKIRFLGKQDSCTPSFEFSCTVEISKEMGGNIVKYEETVRPHKDVYTSWDSPRINLAFTKASLVSINRVCYGSSIREIRSSQVLEKSIKSMPLPFVYIKERSDSPAFAIVIDSPNLKHDNHACLRFTTAHEALEGNRENVNVSYEITDLGKGQPLWNGESEHKKILYFYGAWNKSEWDMVKEIRKRIYPDISSQTSVHPDFSPANLFEYFYSTDIEYKDIYGFQLYQNEMHDNSVSGSLGPGYISWNLRNARVLLLHYGLTREEKAKTLALNLLKWIQKNPNIYSPVGCLWDSMREGCYGDFFGRPNLWACTQAVMGEDLLWLSSKVQDLEPGLAKALIEITKNTANFLARYLVEAPLERYYNLSNKKFSGGKSKWNGQAAHFLYETWKNYGDAKYKEGFDSYISASISTYVAQYQSGAQQDTASDTLAAHSAPRDGFAMLDKYEETRAKEYIERAGADANYYLSWQYVYNIEYPHSEIKTMGMIPCGNVLAAGRIACSPWEASIGIRFLFCMYQATNEKIYRDAYTALVKATTNALFTSEFDESLKGGLAEQIQTYEVSDANGDGKIDGPKVGFANPGANSQFLVALESIGQLKKDILQSSLK